MNPVPAGYDSYDEFVAGHPTTPLAEEQEGSPMLYSSGTTGRPKGIRRPLSGLPFGTDAVLAPMLGGIMGFGEGDVYLNPAPLYHSAPLVWSMTAQRLGGTVVVMERFDPERLPGPHRRVPGDPRPVRPDHVRPHAQAAGEARGAATSPACGRSSTPPPRARPRSNAG